MILAILFLAQQQQAAPAFHSKLAVFDWKTRQSTVIYEQDGILEAPNWSRDGKHLLVNTGGNLYRIAPVAERNWTRSHWAMVRIAATTITTIRPTASSSHSRRRAPHRANRRSTLQMQMDQA